MQNSTTIQPPETTGHTGNLLRRFELDYQERGQYLEVGDIDGVRGWILHLSCSKFELLQLVKSVLPVLMEEQVPFRLAVNTDIADLLNSAQFGYTQVGKLVKIYPRDDAQALRLAEALIPLTASFKGPAIPTDAHLGGQVYARYGAYNPVTLINSRGEPEICTYDPASGYTPEPYDIPFQLTPHIHWPFDKLADPQQPIASRLLHGFYKPIKILKADAKGRAIKALRFRKPFFVSWCLIKEGNKHTCMDDHGRDIGHRLAWQKQLQLDLTGKIPIPRVIDFFEDGGNTYLVMQFIKGISIEELIASIYSDIGWIDLDLNLQRTLLTCLLQLIGIIEKMHEAGYVHRDINPVNFIYGKNKTFYTIDLELAYYFKSQSHTPEHPFRVGTIGYMSPEQQAGMTPTVKEDIYGLGALMINFLTNYMRRKLETNDPGYLTRQLLFHTGNPVLVSLIVACLSPVPCQRPELPLIRSIIEDNLTSIQESSRPFQAPPTRYIPSSDHLSQTLDAALRALTSPLLTTQEGIWFSRPMKKEGDIVNEQLAQTTPFGLSEGIAGVLLTLARAGQADLLDKGGIACCRENMRYLDTHFLRFLPNIPCGLYDGGAGVALALTEAARAGLIGKDESRPQQLFHCFLAPASDPSVSTGSAGIILAVMGSAELLGPAIVNLLETHTSTLIQGQQKDGSWLIPQQDNHSAKSPNFSQGTAGIAIALTICARRYPQIATVNAAQKGIDWLIRKARKEKHAYSWRDPINQMNVRSGLSEGTAGIALAFLTAYETFGDIRYRQIAETILRSYPPHLAVQQLSLHHGVSGIGEVYLQAFRILKSEEWLQRAGWLVNLLLHSHRYSKKDGIYWLTDTSNQPTAGLGSGCCGILHFLLRYQHLNRFSFPLLPE